MIRGGRIGTGLLSERFDQVPNRPLGVVLSEKLPVRRELIGSIQSRVPIEAASRVAARVIEITVRAGDRVKRDQVIVTLDARRSESSGCAGAGSTGRGTRRVQPCDGG